MMSKCPYSYSNIFIHSFIHSFTNLLPSQCQSESSHSEEQSSDGEEEEEDDEEFSPSLSPSSSLSCPRPAHSVPQTDSLAPVNHAMDGANAAPGSPTNWGVAEVCRFISSLQGP